jgi:hypothetical protein
MDSLEVKPTPPSGFVLDTPGYIPTPPSGFLLDKPGYPSTPPPGFSLDTAAEKVLGGEIGQVIGRPPRELEPKPGLGYIAKETARGTVEDIKTALMNLLKQGGQFMKYSVLGIQEPEQAAAEFYAPTPAATEAVPKTVGRGLLETAKGLGKLGGEYALFAPKTLINLAKNPRKQIIEDPLGTLFTLSVLKGLIPGKAGAAVRPQEFLTKEELGTAFKEGLAGFPEVKFEPEVITTDVLNRYNATLQKMTETSARQPEEITTWPEMPRVRKAETSPELRKFYEETKAVEEEARKPLSINVKQETDGSLTITQTLPTGPPAKIEGLPPGFNERAEMRLVGASVDRKLPQLKMLSEQGWNIEVDPDWKTAKITSKTEPFTGEIKELGGRTIWRASKPTESITVQPKTGRPVELRELQGEVPESLYRGKSEIGEHYKGFQTGIDYVKPVGSEKFYTFRYAEDVSRFDIKKAAKPMPTPEVRPQPEAVKPIEVAPPPAKPVPMPAEEPGILYRKPPEAPKAAPELPKGPPEAEARAGAVAGKAIEGGAASRVAIPEAKPKIEAKPIEKPPLEEMSPERVKTFEKEIEDRLLNRKELTPEQKEYLKKHQAYEEIERPAVEELIEEEAPIEEVPKGAPRERLVKVTIKTPSGDFTQEITESSVERIKGYAKKLKIDERVSVGSPYLGKWGETLPPKQIETLLKEVMRDVKTLKPEVWEKYSGYPFWPETQKAYKKIKSEQRIKRAVKLEEIRQELQKTPEGKVEWMYLETERQLKEKRTPTFKKAIATTKRTTLDTSANVKNTLLKDLGQEGKEAVMRHDLIAGASAKAERFIKKAEDKIYKGLSKEEEGLLNRAIQSRRTIGIEKYKIKQGRLGFEEELKRRKEIEHPHGLTEMEHQRYTEKNIPKKINERADAYFGEMKKVLDDLLDEGLISEKEHKDLVSKGDYSPRRFIQYIDPDNTYTISGKTITVPDSGLKALDEGSIQVMELNSRELLNQVISRTHSRIFRNRANKALYELADKVPDNGIVKEAKIIRYSEEGNPVYQPAPAGYAKLKTVIEGHAKEMLMPDEYAREWVTRDPLVNQKMATIIGWLSGSKILKTMATGINPGFAITNLPRDIVHIWLTTSDYSSFLPKFGAQMARDLLTVSKDAILRRGRWENYIDEGGGMSFLTYQGRPFSNQVKGVGLLQKVLGYIGETSEILTRLSLRERAIRNGKPPTEATWTARNYLDFSQGGNVIKALDTGVPYLNASVQATRGLFRAAAQRPGQTILKVAQLGTLATGLYLANRYGNRECWDSIPDREKVNSFIITTPFKIKDKAGNERHFYFKIAKDQSQRILCTVFENLMAKALGEKVDGDQIAAAVQDFLPIIPDQNIPPTIDAFLGYVANKDFWRREDIWKGPEVAPREEYTVYTDPAIREIAKKVGASPERLDYAMSQIFTRGNIYTSLVKGGLNSLFDDLSDKDRQTATEKILAAVPDIKRVFNMTPPYKPQEIKELKEAKVEESTRRYAQKRELEQMAQKFYTKLYDEKTRDQEQYDKIKTFIRSQPQEDKERLAKWFVNYGKVYDIPDRSWWMQLGDMPPETRATVFWNKYHESSPEKQEEMKKIVRKIPGMLSERFSRRFDLLLHKWEQEYE